MSFSVVILAAGQGTRMCSSLPKVLHRLGGMPMIERIVSTVMALTPHTVVMVHGDKVEQLKQALGQFTDLKWVHQQHQRGTGHAVTEALPFVGDVDKVLIVYGDNPLISTETLQKLINAVHHTPIGLITAHIQDPTGFGRILRNTEGEFLGVVEEKDASIEEKQVTEINSGMWMVSKHHLAAWLPKLITHNAQQEYYLPDIATFALNENHKVVTVFPQFEFEILGVNTKAELATLERIFQKQEALKLMKQGVSLLDPNRFDVRGQLTVGRDVTIDINAIFEGQVQLGNEVSIGPNVLIKNSVIHDGVCIHANTVIEDAVIGKDCSVGPFARIRPGTELSQGVKVGNFVEIKKTKVGEESKIGHLSYIGDAHIGREVNVGAGTITCNFDGVNKHQTIIEDGVFIGSDTQLIAPVRIGAGATIGAGTTVVKDVLANQLIHNQVQHRSIINWVRPDASE
jgi:bifunctional UDP-N-acetylglucosamine pyrophosphorylase/glucosamine-1-phosphate N-acetyltransferase